MERVILKANEGEERYFLDDPEIGEDVMEEEIEGILTVEDEVGYHISKKSALYDDWRNDMSRYVDQVREGEAESLQSDARYIVTYFYKDGSGLTQLVDFGIRKEQILENIKNQKYVEGADYFLMGQLKPLATSKEKQHPYQEKAEAAKAEASKAEAAKAETSKDEAALEIDNAIELTWIFAKQDKHISLDVLPYAELKELIADTAKKFEEAHRGTDWNEEDYGEEIQHAADEALALKLWEKFSEVPVSTTSHGIEITKPWNGFRTGTRWTEILEWFVQTFPGMDFRNMLMETQAVKRPTIADPLKIETPLGTIRVYEATDPNCPGVYIDLGNDPLALVEYTETEADQEGEKIITRVWADTKKEDYTYRIVHKI